MSDMKTIKAAAILIAISAFPAVAWSASNGESSGQTQTDPLQIARGAQEWQNDCGRCHNYRSPSEFSDKNWHVIVNHMRVIAPLTGKAARDIEAFLKASNGVSND